jgi:hypothetical protein
MWQNHKEDAELLRRAESVLAHTALYRRRVRAIYVTATIRNRPAAQRIFISVAIMFLLIVGSRAVPLKRNTQAQDFGIPLSALTPVHKFDRFSISHTVRDGETIWGISILYYRSYSHFYQKRLRDANPWLPEDPRNLKIGLTIKIPLV